MTLKELMEKSIPRPWHTEGDGQIFGPNPEFDPTDLQTHDEILIADVAPENVALTEYDAANAALIVHCANNFAQVVEALDRMHHFLARVEGFLQQNEAWGDEEQDLLEANEQVLAAAQAIPSGEKEVWKNEWNCPHCGGETEDDDDGFRWCHPCSERFLPSGEKGEQQ